MELVRITAENFPTYWPEIKPLLQGACDRSRGRFSPDCAIELLVNGQWQFWVGVADDRVQVFAVTEILTFPTGLMAGNIIITTGRRRHQWKHLIDELAVWFKSRGCTVQQTLARKGWARELPAFAMTHVLLERTI